ncbi:hypothetical protein [Novosphingobium sp. KN65.2]|uniref:hypothetical protein n=1 Tax=Novosphingobium sp. KN65.2 TaxID=1478134 RepID=UPI0005E13C3D|nr:hypothetical protein [Novosphingobium sp. KN65.2]CDO37632.1 hypothetical protein SPHV1_370019 [Novosphingobium sp. KN65.2]
MSGQTETTSGAQCPACKYVNDMPFECLRDHWQDLDCDRCGQALEFRGVSCPDTTWEFEIHTRTVVASVQAVELAHGR